MKVDDLRLPDLDKEVSLNYLGSLRSLRLKRPTSRSRKPAKKRVRKSGQTSLRLKKDEQKLAEQLKQKGFSAKQVEETMAYYLSLKGG